MAGQWWDTGYKGFEKAKEERARAFGPRRFFIPRPKPNEYLSKNLVFLSDDPFGFWEHGWKINGSWTNNHAVCLAGIAPPCPMDEPSKNKDIPISKYYVGLFSMLDMSEWTNKDGKVYKFNKTILPAKDKLVQKIKRHKEKRGSLIGCEYTFTRDSGDQTPATGDDIEFVKQWDIKELLQACKQHFLGQKAKQEFVDKFSLDPFDFTKLIVPRERAELAQIVSDITSGRSSSSSSSGSSGGGRQEDAFGGDSGGTEDDIPF